MNVFSEKVLICGLCQQDFDLGLHLPRIIPDCGHTFCEDCIFHKIIQSQQTFRCPEDQQISVCKRQSIADFPKNMSVTSILQHMNFRGNESMMIQQRPSTLAEVISQQSQFLRTTDITSDKSMTGFLTSQINPISTYQQLGSSMIGGGGGNGNSSSIRTQYLKPNILCEEHTKARDLGCTTCQIRICSHCAIFGDHKGHQVVPEDEVRASNEGGLEEMFRIKSKIQTTREGFFQKMEENFRSLICSKIDQKKESFKGQTKAKFQEFIKAVELAAQKSEEDIEQFFTQIEEKFRKFKNHTFTETFDKIISFNQMVEDTRIATDVLRGENELNFDLYNNLDSLIQTGNEIDKEYNNLLSFPVKLIGDYLNNLQISFNEGLILNHLQNTTNITFTTDEAEVISKSIQNLTIDNQREILANSQFLSSTPQEIRNILCSTAGQTPSEAFFFSQKAINTRLSQKTQQQQQKQSSTANNHRESDSQDSRLSSNGQHNYLSKQQINLPLIKRSVFKKMAPESKTDVSLENVDMIVAELSQVNMKNGMRDSIIQKDKMLISHIENQNDFIRHTPFNLQGSFQSNTGEIQPYNNSQMSFNYNHQDVSNNFTPRHSNNNSVIKNNPNQKNYLNESPKIHVSKSKSPFQNGRGKNSYNPNPKIQATDLGTSQYSSNTERPKTPSQISATKQSVNFNNSQLLSRNDFGTKLEQSSLNASISASNLIKKSNIAGTNNSISAQKNTLKLIKSPTKLFQKSPINNGNQEDQQNISTYTVRTTEKTPPKAARRPSAISFKKKSEKLQSLLQKLRGNLFIDTIDLVGEDINDQECEELARDIGRYSGAIESVKLVKNKISDVGLKMLLEGLQQSRQNIHTLNMTSNICTENCLEFILPYLQTNTSLKNIYLVHNNVILNKNNPVLKEIQQISNLRI